MTRKRATLTILAGLLLLVVGPAIAGDTPSPLQDVQPVVEYPTQYSLANLFDDMVIAPPDPIDVALPLPRPITTSGDQTGLRNAKTESGRLGAIGTSMFGSQVDTGMSRPDLESLIRNARRTLDE